MDSALVLLLSLPLVAAIFSGFAARRLWLRRGALSKSARIIAALAIAAGAYAILLSVIGLVKGFGAVGGESLDPSQKAVVMARDISEAMNSGTFGLLLGIASSIVLWVVTRERKQRSS